MNARVSSRAAPIGSVPGSAARVMAERHTRSRSALSHANAHRSSGRLRGRPKPLLAAPLRAVAAAPSVAHPLEPLTNEELKRAAEIVRGALEVPGEMRFEMIQLREPSREAVRGFAPGAAVDREARVNVYTTGQIGVWKCLVSLTENSLLSTEHVPDARSMIQLEEFELVEAAVKRDQRFIDACRKRGITDMSLVCVDPWSAGNFGVEGEEGLHLSHTFAWVRSRPGDNYYAHPIEGVNAIVDIKRMAVIRVDDYGVTPVPAGDENYEAHFFEAPRRDLQPLQVVQPEGVSFRLDGHELRWAGWSLRLGFNGREGLTLHDIQHSGRPVLYRAAVSEMLVPYGSPHMPHARKNVFDIGEYGLGKLANKLTLGCDCLGAIQYLDAWLTDFKGESSCIENAVCIHEEDYGVLWKHWDFRTDHAEVRRARRLVVSFIATVCNYEYASYWYLYLDGTIEFEMKATGVINTVACEPGNPTRYGTEVAPGVAGQIHQHIFCAKLDLAIDGDRTTVVECDTVAEPPGPENPYGNAFYVQETPITTSTGRRADPASQRFWKFESGTGRNRMGRPTAYKLEPVHPITCFLDPAGPSGQRTRFTDNTLWVTASDPEERYPAGEFMNHSDGSGGVPQFAAQERPVQDTAVTAWHVFGLHHVVRLEDYPVQPCVVTGFKLMPTGFFDRNPGIDLAADENTASRQAAECCNGNSHN